MYYLFKKIGEIQNYKKAKKHSLIQRFGDPYGRVGDVWLFWDNGIIYIFNGLLPAYKNPVSINNKIVSVPTTLYNMTFACQSARSVVKPSSLSYWLSPSLSVHCTFLALSSDSWSPCSGTAASTVLLFPSWNAGYIFLVEALKYLWHVSSNIWVLKFHTKWTL